MDCSYDKVPRWPRISARFSLRTLLTAMLICAVLFAWFGWRLRKSQRQAQAVGVLQSLGALCAYDFQTFEYRRKAPSIVTQPLGKPIGVIGRSSYPPRLRKLLGVDFLHNVTRVDMQTTHRLSDADMERLWNALADLPDLVDLEASGPVTKPALIQRLRHTGRLQRLALRWANIADDDLKVLSRMPRLQELNLNETPVTDAAMIHVGRTPSLRTIELHHTKVTDAGMATVAQIQGLRRLRLSGTEVGNLGMHYLRSAQELTDLDLGHTLITDRGIEEVASLTNLERLDLSMNAVTERGIRHLAGLEQLKYLVLEQTKVGPEGLHTLPLLHSLEEVFLNGSIASADLSPLGLCRRLRILSCPLAGGDPIGNGLKLPLNLEQISGARLSDGQLCDQLVSLPNLKVLHAHFSYEPDEVTAVNRFKMARPDVQVLNR